MTIVRVRGEFASWETQDKPWPYGGPSNAYDVKIVVRLTKAELESMPRDVEVSWEPKPQEHHCDKMGSTYRVYAIAIPVNGDDAKAWFLGCDELHIKETALPIIHCPFCGKKLE